MTKILLVLFLPFITIGCVSNSSKTIDKNYDNQADSLISNYSITKNSFYGYELLKPLPQISNVSAKVDSQTGGSKYVFPDPKKNFSVITIYVNDGVITRLTLAKAHDSGVASDKFWNLIIEQANESYPKEILRHSGIGSYIKFLNSPQTWKERYREHFSKKAAGDYSYMGKTFDYGYHPSLASISFDQFSGKEGKVYITIDYITSQYRQNLSNHSDQLRKKISDI